MFAVVITGPPGAGKSAVLEALVDALSADEIAHAAIEVEALVWMHPMPTDEHRHEVLRSVCELHRAAGHDLLLVAETIEADAGFAQLLAAVGARGRFLVRLEAQPETLVRRIIAREPPSWQGRDALVDHARELAATMPALDGVDLVISTENANPEDVAARIRSALPDRLGSEARRSSG